MAEVHQLPNMDDVYAQASEWIARLHADDTSVDDRAHFETWLKAHPRHERAYEELLQTWRQFADAGHIVRAVSFGNAMNEAAAPARPTLRIPRLAAVLAILALGIIGWWIAHLPPGTSFQTAIGEHASISLPDGSSLELNSNSLARVDYTEQARVIHLERGEAFFKVQHDTQRPFWVVAGNSWVRAVGTAFNIRYVRTIGRDSGIRVTVSEGTVKVAAASNSRLTENTPSDMEMAQAAVSVLTVGEQVDVRGKATQIRSLKPTELTRSIAWRQGSLYFENQPLGDVIDEMSRYTQQQILLENNTLRQLPVGGTFQANPQGAETLLTMLEEGLGLEVRRDGDRTYISGTTP